MAAKTLAIANQKGGVGKTTTAVNLASLLAAYGHRTLLVDLDPQGNASMGLGFGRERTERNTYHVLMDGEDVREIIQATQVEKLGLLPASIDLTGAELELADVQGRETVLREALLPVKRDYEFILIDCPPSLGLLTLNGLTAADGVLIPVQAEFYALAGVALLLNTLAGVQASFNEGLRVEGALITMVDSRATLNQQVINELREMFRERVFETVVPRNVRLAEAPSHGQPIHLYDRASKGAQAYQALAMEVLNRSGYGQTPAAV
jgi:chromosome partitioning protein